MRVNSEDDVVQEVTFEQRPDERRTKSCNGRALQAEKTSAKALRQGHVFLLGKLVWLKQRSKEKMQINVPGKTGRGLILSCDTVWFVF